MNKLGYKVVRFDYGEYVSIVFRHDFKYVMGQETLSDLDQWGPLAVFDELKDAKDFLMEFAGASRSLSLIEENFKILKVKYRPITRTWKGLWRKYKGIHVEGFDEYFKALSLCPKGTVLAKSVTPIEVIE